MGGSETTAQGDRGAEQGGPVEQDGQGPQGFLAAEVIRTYRNLRIAIVATLVALGVALVVQWQREPPLLGSISAYYYTPVRNIFVGAILAGSLAMIAVRGRHGGENIVLNISGTLLPVVALVPTPIPPAVATSPVQTFAGCPEGLDRCVPPAAIPGIEVGIWALLGTGVFALVASLSALAWRYRDRDDSAKPPGTLREAIRNDVLGIASAAVVLLLGAGLFFDLVPGLDGRRLILQYAHYGAALVGVGLLGFIMVINWLKSDAVAWRRIYRSLVSVLVGALAVTAVAAFWMNVALFERAWLFWIEAVVLSSFMLFWVAQTAQFWQAGLPDGATDAAAGAAQAGSSNVSSGKTERVSRQTRA